MAETTRALRIGAVATAHLRAHPCGEGKTRARLCHQIHTLAPGGRSGRPPREARARRQGERCALDRVAEDDATACREVTRV